MNNIFPNYSVDREPTRYGGYREDYQLKSKEIIREGIKKIKISPKELISEAPYAKTVEIVEGCRAFKTTSCHAGLEQRWVVIFSQAAYQREYPTLSKHDLRAMQKKPKPLLSSCNKSFYVQTMLNVN